MVLISPPPPSCSRKLHRRREQGRWRDSNIPVRPTPAPCPPPPLLGRPCWVRRGIAGEIAEQSILAVALNRHVGGTHACFNALRHQRPFLVEPRTGLREHAHGVASSTGSTPSPFATRQSEREAVSARGNPGSIRDGCDRESRECTEMIRGGKRRVTHPCSRGECVVEQRGNAAASSTRAVPAEGNVRPQTPSADPRTTATPTRATKKLGATTLPVPPPPFCTQLEVARAGQADEALVCNHWRTTSVGARETLRPWIRLVFGPSPIGWSLAQTHLATTLGPKELHAQSTRP